MKKFRLTDETIEYQGLTLHRIQALRDFTVQGMEVSAGEMGGYLEKESNLSQDGDAWVSGNAWVYGDDRVCSMQDIFIIGPIGSRDAYTTFCKSKVGGIIVSCGCFKGSLDEFLKKVSETHGDNEHGKAYRMAAEIARMRILKSGVQSEELHGEDV